LVPASLGGAELNHPDFVKIVEIFAAADSSTAWCVNQNNVFATDAARMPAETARKIWSEPRAVVTNGPPTRDSKAIPIEGGYHLSGRWNFSSGSNLATWIAARAPVERPAVDATPKDDRGRMFLVPKSAVPILDFWHVNGLRGTASFSFEFDDLFVPESHTYNESDPPHHDAPIYAIPKVPLFAIGFATISLALTRASIDDGIDLAGMKMPLDTSTLLRNHTNTQRLIGRERQFSVRLAPICGRHQTRCGRAPAKTGF
jgi:hypothetical protein